MQEFERLSSHWQTVTIDVFIVMPTHVHAIIFMLSNPPQPDLFSVAPALGQVIGGYKAGVTRLAHGQSIEETTIWQSRYHDHIIRNEKAFNTIYSYILTNPERWHEDTFYEPMRTP